MVDIGAAISATLERIKPYGAYFRFGDEVVFVPAGNYSWPGQSDNPLEGKLPGDSLDVFVLRYNYQTREIVGSFKHLSPEKNPYRRLARLAPDAVLNVVVLHNTAEGAIVGLPNGVSGIIPTPEMPKGHPLLPGDDVRVTILAIEPDDEILHLRVNSRGGGQ